MQEMLALTSGMRSSRHQKGVFFLGSGEERAWVCS
jgi:hypothetical protein